VARWEFNDGDPAPNGYQGRHRGLTEEIIETHYGDGEYRFHVKVAYRTYGKSAAARRSLKIPEVSARRLGDSAGEALQCGVGVSRSKRLVSSWRQLQMANLDAGNLGCGDRVGGRTFTFHEMRHTAATFMVDGGADPLQVMRRMGHSDIRTTYNLYGHLFPDREDELVAKLNSRHDRALRPPGVVEDGKDQENAFEFSLSSTPSGRPRGGARRDDSRLTRGNVQWAQMDLNHRPHPYQGCALTELSYGPQTRHPDD
jgi:hypothetical protein